MQLMSMPPTFDGNTPLHFALNRPDAAKEIIMLLHRGADPFLENHAGLSQVQLAADRGYLPILMVAASRTEEEKRKFIACLSQFANRK